jgi:hypothetical protein
MRSTLNKEGDLHIEIIEAVSLMEHVNFVFEASGVI